MSIVHLNNHSDGSSGVNAHLPNNTTDQITPQNGDKFSSYFDQWIEQQRYDLQSLLAATLAFSLSTPAEHQENHQIQSLIDRVVSNYENYYNHKSNFAKIDVKLMFSPSWTSTTENMFLWVGGWRPSMAFHLLYSKSGVQLDSHLAQVINGTSTHDLSDISHSQMQQIDKLQIMTIKLEREISEKMAENQETGANKQMVEVVNISTETGGSGGENEGEKMLKPPMETIEQHMEKVLEKADQLRMNTLRGVISILKPLQALHFLVAAAELHLRVHEYGKSMDAQRTLAT